MRLTVRRFLMPAVLGLGFAVATGALTAATFPPPAWAEVPDGAIASVGNVTAADPATVTKVSQTQAEVKAIEVVRGVGTLHAAHSALVNIVWDPRRGFQPCTCWVVSLATNGPVFGVAHTGAAPAPRDGPGLVRLQFMLVYLDADTGSSLLQITSTVGA
jgi:hypothetical protein